MSLLVIRINERFYNFVECDDEDLIGYITIEKYNSCPCCSVVNNPTIKGLIEYPIMENRLVNDLQGVIAVSISGGNSYGPRMVEKDVLVGVATDVVYQCSNLKCKRLFIVHYQSEQEHGEVQNTIINGVSPYSTAEIKVSTNIQEICDRYYEIYKQAHLAEMMGLTDICGMGYRKALEFLIKDYIVFLNSDNLDFDKDQILKKPLSQIIKDHIDNKRLKELSERAVWLGNDETHYLRKWIEKDVSDLKKIISIVEYDIEMEFSYRKTLEEMPTGKR